MRYLLSTVAAAVLLSASVHAATDQCTASTVPCSSATSSSVLVDGQPFVPLGIWYDHAGVAEPERTQRLLLAIDNIAARGMNLIVVYWLPAGEAGAQIMRYARGKGVRLIPFLEWHSEFTNAAQSWKNNPGLFGYFTQDDSNSPSTRRCDQADIKALWQSNGEKNRAGVRAGGDTRHVTMISPQARATQAAIERTSTGLPALQGCAEVLATQSYPWTGDSNPWGERVRDVFNHGRASRLLANKYNQAYLRAVQAWRDPSLAADPTSVPTPALLRNMAWQAIASGAQGLIWYAYQDPGWRLYEHPALLEAIAAFIKELKPYTAYVRNGRAAQLLSTGSSDVVASQIPHPDGASVLLSVVNTARSPQSFAVSPPNVTSLSGQLDPLAVLLVVLTTMQQ